jgi:hypothetical protein
MPAPLKIYLDSSDFSVLSDPKHLSRIEIRELRSQLFKWRAENKVKFFYSAVHVVEAAAVEAQYTEKAKERSRLIHDLCGCNVFDIFPEVLRRETLALAGNSINCNFARNDGRWFPFEISNNVFSETPRLTIETLRPNIEKMGHGRWESVKKSPALQRELLAAARAALNRKRESTIKELMSTFSIDYVDADFFNKFSLGMKKREELSAYILRRLRDPTFLIQMRPSNYNGFNDLFEWMRSTSKSFHETLSRVIEALQTMCAHAEDGEAAARLIASFSSDDGLQYYAVQLYEHLARSLLTHAEVGIIEKLKFDEFIRFAPGSYTFVFVAMNAVCRSFTKSPRRPKQSDMVDMFHSFYAPYVDIYRTDGFMAPITEKYVKRFDTTVVGKLPDLIEAVQKALATRPK